MSTVTLVKQGGNPTFTSLTVIQGITGSLYGTASHAVSASYTPGSGAATSASYAATSSLPLLGIVTASVSSTTITFTRGNSTTFDITVAQSGSVSSASYANYASNAGAATTLLTARNIYGNSFNGSADVTGTIIDTYISSAATWNAKQAALSGTGFVKISGTTISYDNSTYLTGNQTITLSGDISGTGATSITTAIGASKVTNAMLAGSIASSKLVGTDIATVGTITSGTWNGTAIGDTYISSAATWNAKQPQLNGTGFVKATGTTISYDNSTYITGNQTITLSGDISGTGTTAITTTIGASKVTNAMLAGSINYSKMDAATVPTWNQNTTGNAATATAVSATIAVDTNANLVYANVATDDYVRIRAGGAYNAGYLEIATADDGTEPIYVRQYTGVFSSLTRTATLLDGSGNTSFPNNVQLGASQNRPVQYDSNNGNFRITPNNGGWATGYFFNNYSGAFKGGFGGFGSGDTFNYYWIGGDYNTATMYITSGSSAAGNVGIGTSSPAYTLDVTGTGRFTGNISAANLSGTNTGDQTNISGNAANVTGIVAIANGGSGATTRKAASSAIANFGQLENHGTYTDANAIQQWGGTYLQGSTNGHGFNGSTQYYQMMLSLGANYDWGSGNAYAMQMMISRNVTTPYIGIRYKEGGADTAGWNSWQKISAGYADSAGTATSATSATSAGNATTAGGLAVHTGRNNEADKIVRTDANGYIQCGYINSSNGNENNNANADRVWGTNGSDDYLRTYRTSALSVSYAASAGGVAWSNVSSKPAAWLNATNLTGDNTPNTTMVSGFYNDYAGAGNPVGTWFSYVNVRHTNPANVYGHQHGMSFYDNDFWFRSYSDGSYQSWAKALSSQNYTSYVVPKTGGDFTGNIGVVDTEIHLRGVADPTHKFYYTTGDTDVWEYNTKIEFRQYNSGGTRLVKMGFTSGGTMTVAEDLVAYGSPSDITLKTNIKPLEGALEKIMRLQGVSFTWKEDTDSSKTVGIKDDIGFIAQEVQKVIPDLVRKNDNGLLSLRDKGITALLVEAIKEQQKQINELKYLLQNK